MIEQFDWLQRWPGLRDLLAQYGFSLPDGLASQADFIRWLREQQAALARQAALGQPDPRLEGWPALIDALDAMGILCATDHWLIETASKDDRTPSLRLDPRLNTPVAGVVAAAFGSRVFARPEATASALDALGKLRKAKSGRPLHVRFNPQTGLPRSLAADAILDFAVSQGQDIEQTALKFVAEYGRALHGDGELPVTRVVFAGAIGNTAHLQQLDASGVPIYGATTAFSFDDDGKLTFIQNGWYPLPSDLPAAQPARSSEAAEADAVAFLRQAGALSPKSDIKTVKGSGSEAGLVRLPTLARQAPDKEPGEQAELFPLAWSVLVIDHTQGKAWEVLVADRPEEGADGRRYPILDPYWRPRGPFDERGVPEPDLLELSAHVLPQVWAYADNAAARDGSLTQFDLAWASAWSGFDFDGAGYATPQTTPAPTTLKQKHSGNVYYHLFQAAKQFDLLRVQAWPSPIAPLPKLPGIELRLPVFLESGGTSEYVPTSTKVDPDPTGKFQFRDGLPNSNNIDDQLLDCEVLYHEYTHAVLHQVRREVVENIGTGYLQANFRRAVNEGLAFYFGAALAERAAAPGAAPARWGEYAYRRDYWATEEPWFLEHTPAGVQKEGWDFLPVYNHYSQLDPFHDAKSEHLCGMVLARALWNLRRIFGPETDAVVLHAVSMLGGIPDGMTPLVETILQRLRDLGRGANEAAQRLLWLSRGIVANAAVRALLRFELDGQLHALAAAERVGCASGCFYVTAADTLWRPLGRGGPHDLVALAAVEVLGSETPGHGPKVLLFAAGDRWSPVSDAITSDRLYWYILDPADPDKEADWHPLPAALPDTASVLSLAAQPGTADNAFSLFVATENGVWRFDGSWQSDRVVAATGWPLDPIPTVRPTYGLVALDADVGGGGVAAVGRTGVSVLDALPPIQLGLQWALSAAANAEFLWVGSADHGVRRFDFATSVWQQVGAVLPSVLCLLAPEDGGPLLAGTSRGLYQWSDPNWAPVLPGGAHLGIVTCLGRDPTGRVLVVSESHGLLRLDDRLATAEPFFNGIPRAGAAIDVIAPPGAAPFLSHLAPPASLAGGPAIYTIYVPDSSYRTLRMQTTAADNVAVYFSAPYIDLASNLLAGLQVCPLQSSAGNVLTTMTPPVNPGYYLIVVQPDSAGNTIDLSLIP